MYIPAGSYRSVGNVLGPSELMISDHEFFLRISNRDRWRTRHRREPGSQRYPWRSQTWSWRWCIFLQIRCTEPLKIAVVSRLIELTWKLMRVLYTALGASTLILAPALRGFHRLTYCHPKWSWFTVIAQVWITKALEGQTGTPKGLNTRQSQNIKSLTGRSQTPRARESLEALSLGSEVRRMDVIMYGHVHMFIAWFRCQRMIDKTVQLVNLETYKLVKKHGRCFIDYPHYGRALWGWIFTHFTPLSKKPVLVLQVWRRGRERAQYLD